MLVDFNVLSVLATPILSYDDLVALVPTLNGLMMDGETPASADLVSAKPSKAAILQRSIDYVQWLEKEAKRQEEEVEIVRREVTGLKIMKDHYQQMLTEAKQVGSLTHMNYGDFIEFRMLSKINTPTG